MSAKEILIEKLYKGECSRKELEMLLDLIQEDEKEDQMQVLERLWIQLKSYNELEEPAASAIIERTLAHIGSEESQTRLKIVSGIRQGGRTSLKRRRFFPMAGIAASLLLIAGAFAWFWFGNDQKVTIATAYAEQKNIRLPDQSIVKLNANSSISFRKEWNRKKSRRVWLEGEAHFEVRKDRDAGRKFQVITKDLTVEVMGTVFNVNARSAATKVYLEEGKVHLHLEEQEEDIVMEPGELVTYSRLSGKPEKKRIEKEAPSSWKDGTALMEDALLKDIVQKIEETYGVRVIVENKAHLEREFSIGIPVDKPETGFMLLKELTGLNIEKVDDRWIVR